MNKENIQFSIRVGQNLQKNVRSSSTIVSKIYQIFANQFLFSFYSMLVSKNIYPYKCMDCPAQFKDVQEAKIHFKTAHEGKKLFRCTICEVPFSSLSCMKRHVRIVHEGKRPFKCKVCGKSFGISSHMKRHIASIHESKKDFNCELCDYNCSRKSTLNTHTALVYEGKIVQEGKKQ